VPALRNFEVSAWVGMFAPAGTPPAALSLIQREVAKIVATRDFRSALLSSFMMAAEPQTPEQFAQEVRQDTAKWSRAARDAKLAPLD
jgi:tripartite-type tricarboxylate transporter receptor subunit TctC